jgi:hypothetical protein
VSVARRSYRAVIIFQDDLGEFRRSTRGEYRMGGAIAIKTGINPNGTLGQPPTNRNRLEIMIQMSESL